MLNATVLINTNLAPGLFLLRIRPDQSVEEFKAGQYITLGLPANFVRPEGGPGDPESFIPDKLIRRAYSVASSPEELPEIEFFIALVPEGALTPRLSLLKPGDRLYMTQKFVGKFTLDSCQGARSLVFLATGTGVAPFISMLRTSSTWEVAEQITLLHGVRYGVDLAYGSELDELEKKRFGQFKYIPVVSRENPPANGFRGYVQNALEPMNITLLPERDHVFACGNPGMVNAIETEFINLGFKLHEGRVQGNLHLEKYW